MVSREAEKAILDVIAELQECEAAVPGSPVSCRVMLCFGISELYGILGKKKKAGEWLKRGWAAAGPGEVNRALKACLLRAAAMHWYRVAPGFAEVMAEEANRIERVSG